MKFKIFAQILISMTVLSLISCESGSSTEYQEKLVLYCYAKADSTIDSLYLSRSGSTQEAIDFAGLAVSRSDIGLYEKHPDSTEFKFTGSLTEYPERPGMYYIGNADFPGGFKTGYSYRINADHDDFDNIAAETVCPPPLTYVTARNAEAGTEMLSVSEDPSAVDTLYYRRGESFDDLKLFSCSFDSLSILAEERMASISIIPDEICRIDTSFWLEDTTESVWEDYPVETQIFKDREKYGKIFSDYFLRSISVHWNRFYHKGPHILLLGSTDKVHRAFMESRYSGEEFYTNVDGGYGLFTISNSSFDKSRYRVYVKSLESKYP